MEGDIWARERWMIHILLLVGEIYRRRCSKCLFHHRRKRRVLIQLVRDGILVSLQYLAYLNRRVQLELLLQLCSTQHS